MSPDLEFELARRHPSFDGSPLIDGGCAHGNGWFDILDRMFSGVEALQPPAGGHPLDPDQGEVWAAPCLRGWLHPGGRRVDRSGGSRERDDLRRLRLAPNPSLGPARCHAVRRAPRAAEATFPDRGGVRGIRGGYATDSRR